MPKNAQTTVQLYSFHMVENSKSFKLGFNSTWIENLQMYKLDLEKAQEPEIKLPVSIGSQKSKGISEKHDLCFIDYVKAFDCVDHNTLWKALKEMQY